MTILVTGAAGFIGYHVVCSLLSRGDEVIGVDNLNAYYDVSLKQARLDDLAQHARAANFTFLKLELADTAAVDALFSEYSIDAVIHLAAQAGVR